MLTEPHHDGSALYVPVPDPRLGDTVPVLLRVPRGYPVNAVHLRSVYDGEPRFVPARVDRTDDRDTWWRADLLVHNPVTSYRWLLDRGADGYAWSNAAGTWDHDVTDAADHRLTTHGLPPAWARDGVVYQVFPDRFARSATAVTPEDMPAWATPARWGEPVVERGPDTPHQLYGGDLRGIVDHLDDLLELGVTVLYLTPFFPAESNHRYNATTFDHVDPLLGGDEALTELTAAAHARGMRVIGDLTTNHTGDTHAWFRRAQADPSSVEASYYYFDQHPDRYAAWFDEPTLPKLRHSSPELRAALVEGQESVVARWLRPPFALDGWRIDVANMTGRSGADDLAHDVARAVRATMADVAPDALLVAEHFHDAGGDLTGDGWHATMNYAAFTKPLWAWLRGEDRPMPLVGMPVDIPSITARHAVAAMRTFAAATPWAATAHAVNLLGSHDTARPRTLIGDDARLTVGAGILFTYPGIPMIFMGDEFGLEGIDGEDSRTPMPWGRDPASPQIAQAYRALIALRHAEPALRHGGLRWAHAGTDALAYVRETADDALLVVAARAPVDSVRLEGLGREDVQLVHGDGVAWASGDDLVVKVGGPGFAVWRL